MSKFMQAFLTGLFFTFLLDFLLFLGIFINYIQKLDIELYYNILFADNQSIIVFLIFSFIIGYLVIYNKNTKITLSITLVFFVFASLSLIPTIGYRIGEMLLMKKNVSYKSLRYTFTGNAYYDGRKNIVFYDNQLKKVIILKKDTLQKY